ncbi:uncharacterized protein A1O9_09719 [Exophiala aquamarina CBS 119918]|uniref:Uncharacterized protein n=1 Tax=Exophiala aquamarina CBS 119918 TaxID=1182545 RepID=A0A072P1C8_9EURO|nr:uncharacterized protein A1O9_09719 [Exophiala aquamarina CBS 119918]KEF53924.1 hypothetical protein A1O9_09719 [Exophiala aquamarina CBS 119918]
MKDLILLTLSIFLPAVACLSDALPGASVFYPCPFIGPTYLQPTNLSKDPTIKAAAGNTTAVLLDAIATGLLENQTTAFSLTAFSTSDEKSTPFYTFHQTPPILAEAPLGVKNVTGDTVYRVGSLSKVLTVNAHLVADGFKHFQDPIKSTVWDDITLQALASHMGGIGVEYGALDIAKSPFPYTELDSLPKVPQQQLPPCGGPLGSPLCTREQFLEGMTTKHPVFPAFHSPSYSNVAFSLLTYATEAITGKKFPDILQSKVFSPLNMTRSFYEKPSDDLGVIPGDPTILFWNVSGGELNPGAGYYSSPNDLAIFGRTVLGSKQLTTTQTRRWMKPVSHTADPFASVGAPWEIARYTLPTDPYKTIDLYAKSGAFGYYTAYLILVPDYGVGFSVNAAGSVGATGLLANIITESFIPALQEASRLQTEANYAGQYVSSDKEYSFILSSDQNTPGLHLTNFTGPEDSNVFATLALLASNGSAPAAYNAGLFGLEIDLRLFPTMLEDNIKEHNGTKRVGFRAAAGLSESLPPGPFTAPCGTWLVLDTVELGGSSFDEFTFDVDEKGAAVAVNHRFLRQTFTRYD